MEDYNDQLENYGVLGCSIDGKLYTVNDFNDHQCRNKWSLVNDNVAPTQMLAIDFLFDGSLIGLGKDQQFYVRPDVEDVWRQINFPPLPTRMISIAGCRSPFDYFYCLGENQEIYQRWINPKLPWRTIGKPSPAIALKDITTDPDYRESGTLLFGLSQNNKLYRSVLTTAHTGPWEEFFPNDGQKIKFKNIFRVPDETRSGIFLGLSDRGTLYFGLEDGAIWEEIPSSGMPGNQIISIAPYYHPTNPLFFGSRDSKLAMNLYTHQTKGDNLDLYVYTPSEVKDAVLIIGFMGVGNEKRDAFIVTDPDGNKYRTEQKNGSSIVAKEAPEKTGLQSLMVSQPKDGSWKVAIADKDMKDWSILIITSPLSEFQLNTENIFSHLNPLLIKKIHHAFGDRTGMKFKEFWEKLVGRPNDSNILLEIAENVMLPAPAITRSHSPEYLSNWLGRTPGIDQKELYKIVFPGTHDSGSSGLTGETDKEVPRDIHDIANRLDAFSDFRENFLEDLVSKIMELTPRFLPTTIPNTLIKGIDEYIKMMARDIGIAQNHDISTQLKSGIRVFDLRGKKFENEWRLYHGMALGRPLSEAIDGIEDFMRSSEKEIIIVKLRLVCPTKKEDTEEYKKWAKGEEEKKWAEIIAKFGNHLFSYSQPYKVGEKRLASTTYQEITTHPNRRNSRISRIVLIGSYDKTGSENVWPAKDTLISFKGHKKGDHDITLLKDLDDSSKTELLEKSGIFTQYSNTSKLSVLKADQMAKNALFKPNEKRMFELNWTLTPSDADVILIAINKFPGFMAYWVGINPILYLVAPLILAPLATIISIVVGTGVLGLEITQFIRTEKVIWHDLEGLSDGANDNFDDFMKKYGQSHDMNIISVDFFEKTKVVEWAIRLNGN